MRKKLFTFLLALVAGIGSIWAQNPSGTCGENLTWEFNPSTGVLAISGTGAMDNYSWNPAAPWNAYKDDITSVSFPDGITTIGAYAFVSCDNAAFTTVTIPEGVTALGVNAFYNCDGIQEITIPSTVATMEAGAIYDCKEVNSITSYIASPTNLHGYAIYGYKSTCTLYVPYNSIAAYQAADCWKYIPNIAAVWNSLQVGDVIKVGDQLRPSEEWGSANDHGVIKPAWAPYTLLRANIAQDEYDEPVVTEAEDGAYYVLKFTHPSAGTYYLLANSAKGTLLAATATSDGLEVTNVGDYYGTPQFTFAVHESAAPTRRSPRT